MEIRDAVLIDAVAACDILRRSITELCVADHRNDPALLKRWLANKTPELVESWIAQKTGSFLVAIESDMIIAGGSVTDHGTITLNYVSPHARFRASAVRSFAPLKLGLQSEATPDAFLKVPKRRDAFTCR